MDRGRREDEVLERGARGEEPAAIAAQLGMSPARVMELLDTVDADVPPAPAVRLAPLPVPKPRAKKKQRRARTTSAATRALLMPLVRAGKIRRIPPLAKDSTALLRHWLKRAARR